jgi:multidrug efflux system membrane fusion protein
MIQHKDADAATVNGTPALPPAPEQKALPPAPPAPPRRRSRAWLWLLLLAIAGFIAFRSYQNVQAKNAAAAAAQERRAANRSVPVAAAPARRGDLPIYLRGLGTVDAYNTVNVRARVDGPITAVLFKEGQNVAKGEPLVEIDPRTFQATVNQAQGQLARDQAQLHDAEANLARYQALWSAGVIARQQLDTQAAQVGQFKGSIEADQAAIQSARLQLGFTEVIAPISGRIGLRQVDVGNIVHAGDQTPIAVITQMQPIAVLFTIPADSLPPVLAKLRAGAKLPVEAYDRADQNRLATGTLETVDNQIDPATGTSRLKAVFNNQDGVLFPQQFVNARMLLETRHGVVLIPAPALQRGPQGPYVYVVQNGTAAMRPVTVGVTEGSDVQVTSGVAAGEMVVVDGQDKLQEGSKVEVRAEPGTAGYQTSDRAPGRKGAGAEANNRTGTATGTGGPIGQGNLTGNPNRTATPDAGAIPAGRPVRGRGGQRP